MDLTYRIPNHTHWPGDFINQVIQADALAALKRLPSESVALAITSPPYWNMIDYKVRGQIGQTDYRAYLEELLTVWKETYRVLIPNGKLVVITPILPIRKKVINDQHTRHIKNLSNDIEHTILARIKKFKRYSLFVWQKQTSVKMFGSYPYPPNIYEDNTVEFINVYVKDGVPPQLPRKAKEPSKLTQEEWLNLTMQVWPIYPEDIKRAGGHPCPFPVTLPQRLILMFSFMQAPEVGFAGDIVLDMFNGTGATCLAAKATGRNFIGIDLSPEYCKIAWQRLKMEYVHPYDILLEKISVKQALDSRAKKQVLLFPSTD